MNPTHEPFRGEDDQLWLGWKWFELHAKQRLEALKFFLTIFGALMTVGSAFLQSSYLFVAAVAGCMAIGASLLFWQIDRRSLQLIEIGERMIDRRWNALGFPSETNPISEVRIRREDGVRYKHAFLAVFIAAGLSSFGIFVLAVYLLNFPNQVPLPRLH